MHRAIDAQFTLPSTVPIEVMSAERGAEIIPGSQDKTAFLLHRVPVKASLTAVLSACLDAHLTLSQRV